MLSANPKNRPSLDSLLSHPLLPDLSSPQLPPEEIHEGIIRSVAKTCKIADSMVREYIKAGNKNGFTAHYFLELHKMNAKALALKQEVEARSLIELDHIEVEANAHHKRDG